MDVTGVPSTDPGHRSATPVAVAALWAFNAAQDELAPPPLLFCRHPPPGLTSRWGRSPMISHILPRRALSTYGWDPRPPPRGVQDFHTLPDLLVCTPALRPGGPDRPSPLLPPGHCRTAAAISTGPRTKSRMTATCAAFPQCTSYSVRPLYPRFRGKRRPPRPYTHVRRPSLQL